MLGEAVHTSTGITRGHARSSASLARAGSLDEVSAELSGLLDGVYRPGSRFELFLSRGDGFEPCLHRDESGSGESRALLASLLTRLLASEGVLSDPQVFGADETPSCRPVISAPLRDPSDALLGVVVVEGAPRHPDFSRTELVALEGIAAGLAASAPFRGARHARRELDGKAAVALQRGFMSSRLPPGIGVTAQAEYLPAFDVGGDFYSVRHHGDQTVSATIGDVSGNGVSAALLMSRVSADLEREITGGAAPAAALAAVNTRLGAAAGDMFVTAACIRIDPRRRRLTIANAGHLPIVVRRASNEAFTFGGASGTPLGMVDCEYAEDELLLEKGDIVLLATDGLLEALDHPTGHRGMEMLLAETHAAGHDAAAINRRLRGVVDRARRSHPLDDVTWVALQMMG